MVTIKDHVQILQSGTTLISGNEADFSWPKHAATHESGGTDEIDISSLIGTLSHTVLSDIGTNTHTQIDDFIAGPSFTSVSGDAWSIDVNPSAPTVANVLTLSALGFNWSTDSNVLKLISVDSQCASLMTNSGANDLFSITQSGDLYFTEWAGASIVSEESLVFQTDADNSNPGGESIIFMDSGVEWARFKDTNFGVGISASLLGRIHSRVTDNTGVAGYFEATATGAVANTGIYATAAGDDGKAVRGYVPESTAYSGYFEGGSFYVDGSIGIGNSAPEVGLHVGTDSSIFSLTGSDDVIISGNLEINGSQIYTDTNTGSNTNTILGIGAANSISTSLNITAIGQAAGYSNSSGNNWIAIGQAAGYSNTSGNYWMAVGQFAGYSNTSGTSWTAVGMNAGGSNTSGSYWTAVGQSSAFSNVSGENWTSIGRNASRYIDGGANNTTCTQYVCIGYDTRLSADGTSNENVLGYTAIGIGSNKTVVGNSSITETRLGGIISTINGGAYSGAIDDALSSGYYSTTPYSWIQSRGSAVTAALYLNPQGGDVILGGDQIRIATTKTPSSASDTGTTGSICWDSSYVYVCIATDTWVRAATATW